MHHTNQVFQISDAIAVKSFAVRTPLHLSPDGNYLAYAIQAPQRRPSPEQKEPGVFLPTGAPLELAGSEVWVVCMPTGEAHKLTSDGGIDWSPRWSPDGRQLAFYSDRAGVAQLWVWDREEDRQWPFSEVAIRVAFGFEVPQWTPDGTHVIAKLRPDDQPENEATSLENRTDSRDSRKASIIVWQTEQNEIASESKQANALAFAERIHGDVGIFDTRTGEVRRLAQGFYTTDMVLSPDGLFVAVLNLSGRAELTSQAVLFELLLVPLNGTPTRRLAANIRGSQAKGATLSWSPDGQHLVYTSQDGLYLLSTKGGEPSNLTATLSDKPGYIYCRPLWSTDGNSLFCMSDGHLWQVATDGRNARKLTEGLEREVIGAVAAGNTHVIWTPDGGQSVCVQTHNPDTKQDGFYRVQIANPCSTCLVELPVRLGRLIRFDLDAVSYDRQIIYRAEDATHPQDAWIADSTFIDRRQVTRLNPQLSRFAFGSTRLIEWNAQDGRLFRGVLLLPADYEEGHRYPLIVWIRGGDYLSEFVYTFGFASQGEGNFQVMANRGYAVLGVDTPLQSNEPLKELPGLVMPAVDKVIELGIADPERLGIMGYSYGGYSVNVLITQTTRFKAAVSGGGISNLTSYYGALSKSGHSFAIGWSESGQGRMGGSLWEHRQRYIDNSPIFHLDKVEAPLLLYCGEVDADGVALAQAAEMFSGLRRLGKTVVIACYCGENHNTPTWSATHLVDLWQRILDWFEEHLR